MEGEKASCLSVWSWNQREAAAAGDTLQNGKRDRTNQSCFSTLCPSILASLPFNSQNPLEAKEQKHLGNAVPWKPEQGFDKGEERTQPRSKNEDNRKHRLQLTHKECETYNLNEKEIFLLSHWNSEICKLFATYSKTEPIPKDTKIRTGKWGDASLNFSGLAGTQVMKLVLKARRIMIEMMHWRHIR